MLNLNNLFVCNKTIYCESNKKKLRVCVCACFVEGVAFVLRGKKKTRIGTGTGTLGISRV